MTEEYADSTVAWTVYNMVCRTTGNIAKPEILLDVIREHVHSDLTLQRLRRVIRIMKRNGFLVPRGKEFGPCDRKRRIAVKRDRSDFHIDEKGRIRGGWNGWLVRDPLVGLVALEPKPPKAKKESEVTV